MRISRRWFLLSMVCGALLPCFATNAQAPAADKLPSMVMIIRHAEKPLGEGKDPNLTPQGFKRAAALPTLFLAHDGAAPGAMQAARFPMPDALFATDTSKHSNRPIETITPLSQALGKRINHDFADIETGPLAKEVMGGKYAGKVVLICWHHGEIPHLAAAFGVMDAPKKWDDTVFDQVWEITWVDGQAKLKTVPQELLPGDSTK